MILRSQLRMNKNIVFPFISCIMIMFTLLVLIHKSADELNAAKKEISHCKQQHESLYSQFQNAVELKLGLEKSLENEKTNAKQKIEELQASLNQEKEERRKEKDEADNRFDTLNRRFIELQSENTENTDSLNKKVLDLEEEKSKLNSNIKSLSMDNERKDKSIKELQEKIKILENSPMIAKKPTSESNPAPGIPERVDVVGIQSPSNGQTTPKINPQAVGGQDDSPKQVAPPPNVDQENAMQKEMRKSLSPEEEAKSPQENVVKAPQIQSDDDKNKASSSKRTDPDSVDNPDKNNQPNMNLPLPYNYNMQNNKQSSSANNNVVENANQDDQLQQQDLMPPIQNAGVVPAPNEKEKVKEIPREMKEYRDELDRDGGEEEGEDYGDNEIGNHNKNKEKNPVEPSVK